jgi:5-methylcytosine-specific restriction enzyme A
MSRTWRKEPGSEWAGGRRGENSVPTRNRVSAPRPSRRSTTKWQHLYDLPEWRKASREFRNTPEGALCSYCKAAGRITASELVDHIVPHNGDLTLFWDRNNWAASCWSCHSSKGHDDRYRARHGKERPKKGCDKDGFPLDPNHHWNSE